MKNKRSYLNKLSDSCIFFITPDVKRGLGLENILPKFHIICSFYEPIIPILRKQGAKIYCLQEQEEKFNRSWNNSGNILTENKVLDYIRDNSKGLPYIAYFKPSTKLDFEIKKLGFNKIGNDYSINEHFENKVNFYSYFQKDLHRFLIPSIVGKLKKFDYKYIASILGLNFVVQFGHGWAGKTTFFIEKEKDFLDLKKNFSDTSVKISKKIDGPIFLNNCCVSENKLFIGPPALQISGINKLHPNPSVTCGRQWSVNNLNNKQVKMINEISNLVGRIMNKKGYRGYFGLDFLQDKLTGRIYLSEVNARLTASSSFYTKLELGSGLNPLMIYHYASFLNIKIKEEKNNHSNLTGSQIILRRFGWLRKIKSNFQFGKYSFAENKIVKIGSNYDPENLKGYEFIYIPSGDDSGREEFGRIETKKSVMINNKLEQWIDIVVNRVSDYK